MSSGTPTSSQRAPAREMRRDFGAKVLRRQTISSPTTTSQAETIQGCAAASKTPAKVTNIGSRPSIAPAGAGHSDEVGLSDHRPRAADVEAGKPQAGADREDQRRGPAHVRRPGERGLVDDERGRHAEVDEVGERVELGPELARHVQLPGEEPVEPVDQRGEDDERRRRLETVGIGQPQRGQAGAEAEQRHEVRQELQQQNAVVAVHAVGHGVGHGHLTVPGARGLPGREVGQHGFSGDHGLPHGDEGRHALRQVDVEPRAEADEAEALARPQPVALGGEADDAPRHQARDLDHRQRPAVVELDADGVALVVLARLVQRGVDKSSMGGSRRRWGWMICGGVSAGVGAAADHTGRLSPKGRIRSAH